MMSLCKPSGGPSRTTRRRPGLSGRSPRLEWGPFGSSPRSRAAASGCRPAPGRCPSEPVVRNFFGREKFQHPKPYVCTKQRGGNDKTTYTAAGTPQNEGITFCPRTPASFLFLFFSLLRRCFVLFVRAHRREPRRVCFGERWVTRGAVGQRQSTTPLVSTFTFRCRSVDAKGSTWSNPSRLLLSHSTLIEQNSIQVSSLLSVPSFQQKWVNPRQTTPAKHEK